jgi:hypothetical protein
LRAAVPPVADYLGSSSYSPHRVGSVLGIADDELNSSQDLRGDTVDLAKGFGHRRASLSGFDSGFEPAGAQGSFQDKIDRLFDLGAGAAAVSHFDGRTDRSEASLDTAHCDNIGYNFGDSRTKQPGSERNRLSGLCC